jgi:DamX protein
MHQPFLDTQVLQRLGLTAQPFAPPQECEELFHSTSTDMLINSIKQQLSSNNMVQLIIGEHLSGKSCFCRRLLCETPPKLAIYFFLATGKSRINDLFKTLLDGAHTETTDDTQTLAVQAAKCIFRDLRAQQQPVLLVDDAHLLAASVLRMLFRFLDAISKQGSGNVKMVLIGKRKLQEKWSTLGKAAPADENIFTSLLRPLNYQELAGFLTFRFKLAGASTHPFTVKQLQFIQRESAGLPGKIEQLACNLLNKKSAYKQLITPKPLMISAALLLFIAIIAYYMFERRDQLEQQITTIDPAIAIASNTATGTERYNDEISGTASDLEVNAVDSTDGAEFDSVALDSSTNNTEFDTPQTDNANTIPANNADKEDVPDDDSFESATATENTDQHKIEDNDTVLRDAGWLSEWPGDYYVVQLAGFWQKEKLVQLAESIRLEKDLVYLTSQRNEKTWHILLYGVFPDRSSARSAILQLPPELRQLQPWPRPISALLH